MNNYEIKYKKLLRKCLESGEKKLTRTGIDCISIFNKKISININKSFPMLTARKMFEKTFKTEFEWFINGETNIERFKSNNIKIWDAWADKNGDLGPVYGYQLKNFNGENIDQLNKVIESIKLNPLSRRHIISLWNPAQTDLMALPPCYSYFQFYVKKNKLNLTIMQRSGDLVAGVPYDIALFSMLLLYVSEKTNLKPKNICLNIVDAHIYTNQISPAKIYLKRPYYKLPIYEFKNGKIEIKNYVSGESIKIPIAI